MSRRSVGIFVMTILAAVAGASLHAQDDGSAQINNLIFQALKGSEETPATPVTSVTPVEPIKSVQDSSAVKLDTDSLYCDTSIKLDSSYVGKTIFAVLPSRDRGDAGNVTVIQSPSVSMAMDRHIATASFDEVQGYRIRIYFSNAQNAREASLEAAKLFQFHFTGINVYRQFVTPNFKVTVGDFRSRSEALEYLAAVRAYFPAAFIVRENIHYLY